MADHAVVPDAVPVPWTLELQVTRDTPALSDAEPRIASEAAVVVTDVAPGTLTVRAGGVRSGAGGGGAGAGGVGAGGVGSAGGAAGGVVAVRAA
ncbi:MAG: hypothetical protein FJW31_28430 [Acidobacteria bacterium]|nr:hypothetical protein [Acidobacteriota bacterium]